MPRLVAFLAAVSAWADGAQWRTWILHSLIAVPIALAAAALSLVLWMLGSFTPLSAGALTAVFVYLVRELEQVAHRLMRGEPLDPLDHVLDVLVPAVVVIALALIL